GGAAGDAGPPRGGRAGDRPDAASAAGGVSVSHGPAGDLDGPDPRQGPRDEAGRLGQPTAARRGGRVAHPLRRTLPGAGPAAPPCPPDGVLPPPPRPGAVLLLRPLRDPRRRGRPR